MNENNLIYQKKFENEKVRKNDYNFRILWLYVKISKPVDGRLAFFHDLNKWVTVPPHATVGRNVNK